MVPSYPPKLEIKPDPFELRVPLLTFGIPFLAEVYVEAFFGIEFSFEANLSAGFDTRGLRKGGSFLDGFYLGDFEPNDDHEIVPGANDRPELVFSLGLFAGLVHLPIADAPLKRTAPA